MSEFDKAKYNFILLSQVPSSQIVYVHWRAVKRSFQDFYEKTLILLKSCKFSINKNTEIVEIPLDTSFTNK